MKMIHYPKKIRSHLVTIAQMAPLTPKSTSKLRSALHFTYSIVIPRFIPRANTAESSKYNTTTVFLTLLTTTTLLIVTITLHNDAIVPTLYVNEYL